MKFETQTALLQELIDLKETRSAFLDKAEAFSPVERYADPARFAREQARIFQRQPIIAAHASELPEPGSFLTVELFGRSLLLTRDAGGKVHGFLNVCRHRGTRLVHETCGSKRRFSCPYHAWTWNNQGDLVGVPHEKQCFPSLDRSGYGLKQVATADRHGFIWVRLFGQEELDIDAWLGDLAQDFEWFGADRLQVHDIDVQERAANWKILVEGGLEAYHFKIAHRASIGPHFQDNLSSYECIGPHMRSVLAKNELGRLPEKPKEEWDIRTASNLLYTIFPTNSLLLMDDHIAWINMQPAAADRTIIRVISLVPKPGEPLANPDRSHWDRNHAITKVTLTEDFDLNESAQKGIMSGANEAFTFGRFEGALEAFNHVVESCLAS